MKASALKKDSAASIRINTLVKQELKDRGISVQAIIDKYIEELDLEIQILPQEDEE